MRLILQTKYQHLSNPETANYLGMTLNPGELMSKEEELYCDFRKMYLLLGQNSTLSIHNKILLYKFLNPYEHIATSCYVIPKIIMSTPLGSSETITYAVT